MTSRLRGSDEPVQPAHWYASCMTRIYTRRTAQEVIDDSTVRSGDCLLWTGATSRDGYGKAWYEGKGVRAHRLAYFAAHGEWASGLTLHTCDTPICCEPTHLYDGTAADNQRDRSERDRHGRSGRPRTKGCANGHVPYGEPRCDDCSRLVALREWANERRRRRHG